MKKHCGRFVTEEDMKDSEHKLDYMTELDKLVEVCRVAAVLYDQEISQQEKQNIVVVDKSLEKRHVTSDQESSKTVLFSSTTSSISEKELFTGSIKTSKGETSFSSRCCEYGNVWRSSDDRDQLVREKVLVKRRKYHGYGKKRRYCGSKDEDLEYCKKKVKRPRNNVKSRNRVVETAPLPVEFANEIQRLGGNDIRLLIQKIITDTDTNCGQSRISIPINQVTEEAKDFLTESEKKTLNERDADNHVVVIKIPLLEPNLNRSYIDFKKWDMNSSFWYVLGGPLWRAVRENNYLETGTGIQVWSFRVNGDLNLALVKLPQNI